MKIITGIFTFFLIPMGIVSPLGLMLAIGSITILQSFKEIPFCSNFQMCSQDFSISKCLLYLLFVVINFLSVFFYFVITRQQHISSLPFFLISVPRITSRHVLTPQSSSVSCNYCFKYFFTCAAFWMMPSFLFYCSQILSLNVSTLFFIL